MTTSLQVPSTYAWILLECVAIVIQYMVMQFPVGNARKKYLGKKFFKEHFPQHMDNAGGYPDMGHGKFAEKLTIEQWIAFNNTQRVHYNYLEGLPVILVLLSVSGLYYTRYAFAAGIAYIVGRTLYAIGYLTKGANGRLAGVLIFDIALIALLYSSVMTTIHLGGGLNGLFTLLKL